MDLLWRNKPKTDNFLEISFGKGFILIFDSAYHFTYTFDYLRNIQKEFYNFRMKITAEIQKLH